MGLYGGGGATPWNNRRAFGPSSGGARRSSAGVYPPARTRYAASYARASTGGLGGGGAVGERHHRRAHSARPPRSPRASEAATSAALEREGTTEDGTGRRHAFRPVSAGAAGIHASRSPRGLSEPEEAAPPDYSLLGDVELGWARSTAIPRKSLADLARERATPRVMYSANPTYRSKGADGRYIAQPAMNVTPGPPRGAARRPLTAHPSPRARSTAQIYGVSTASTSRGTLDAVKPGTKPREGGVGERAGGVLPISGDVRAANEAAGESKRSRREVMAAAKKEEARRAEEDRIKELERKESAKREAEAARESIAAAELAFYQDTVRDLASTYNEHRRHGERARGELERLEVMYATTEHQTKAVHADTAAQRGGGGAVPGLRHAAAVPGSKMTRGPTSHLTLEGLQIRVTEAEHAAEMEEMRSAGYGHMIMRLRDSDPTDEARRADPFGTLTTTHETALAAAAKNDGDGRRKEDKFENLRHLPWMNCKLDAIQEYQTAVVHEMGLKQAIQHRAVNEHSQAEDMLARAAASLEDRRRDWKEQLTNQRAVLVANRAEEKAVTDRKQAFKDQLAKLRKEAEDAEANKKRGGQPDKFRGQRGNNAKSALTSLLNSKISKESAQLDESLERLQTVVGDINPDRLVEAFHSRRSRIEAIRGEAEEVRAMHDKLAADRNVLMDELDDLRTKHVTTGRDGAVDVDAMLSQKRANGRAEDMFDAPLQHAESRARITQGALAKTEKSVSAVTTAMYNLTEMIRDFEKCLNSTGAGDVFATKPAAVAGGKSGGTGTSMRADLLRRKSMRQVKGSREASPTPALKADGSLTSVIPRAPLDGDGAAVDLNDQAKSFVRGLVHFYECFASSGIMKEADEYAEKLKEYAEHPEEDAVSREPSAVAEEGAVVTSEVAAVTSEVPTEEEKAAEPINVIVNGSVSTLDSEEVPEEVPEEMEAKTKTVDRARNNIRVSTLEEVEDKEEAMLHQEELLDDLDEAFNLRHDMKRQAVRMVRKETRRQGLELDAHWIAEYERSMQVSEHSTPVQDKEEGKKIRRSKTEKGRASQDTNSPAAKKTVNFSDEI